MALFFNKEMRSLTAAIPIFVLGAEVPFSWTRHRDAQQYRYQIVDLLTQESVKLSITSKPQGYLPADRNVCATSYKIAVHALGDGESVVAAWQHFFHVERPAFIPIGEDIHVKNIFFRNGFASPAIYQEKSSGGKMKSLLSSPSLSQGKRQPECMLANRYFLSYNSNNVEHWMNALLGKAYALDLRMLAEAPAVGSVAVDQQMERDAFLQLNAYRSNHSLPQLLWNDNLARSARGRALGHILSPGYNHIMPCIGGSLAESLRRWGLEPQTGLRENIAWMSNNFAQQYRAEDILHTWTNSPTHNENILRNAKYMGVGVIARENASMQGLEAVMISVL